MDFRFCDIDKLNQKELMELLEHNRRCASSRRKEIARLKNACSGDEIQVVEAPSVVMVKIDKKSEKDDDFEQEVDYYLSNLRQITDEQFEEKIDDVLPARKNYNYKKIIMRLMAELSKDIKELYEILLQEKDDISKDDLILYKNEISLLKEKIDFLRLRISDKTEVDAQEEIENKLIFVPTTGDNIRVLDELKNIPREYYSSFLELFLSIKDGTFKGIKRFKNNDIIRGLLEVKGFKVRVVFSRLSKDCYAVITAFIKKSDNDKGYRKALEMKCMYYKKIADKLKSLIDDDEFLKINEAHEKELFDMLGMGEVVKGGQKK